MSLDAMKLEKNSHVKYTQSDAVGAAAILAKRIAMRISFSRVTSAIALSVALAAPLLSFPANAADEGIVVYNAQHETLAQAWAAGFTKETGIKVTIRNGSDMQFANQIIEEGAASPADVFLTENSPAMTLV